ncbi:MAG: hypothetical protein LBF17_00845 [Mediterranea sp.]|jgi:hypothetical protein|nr:hypothetical protein [Mediterranea sp.]
MDYRKINSHIILLSIVLLFGFAGIGITVGDGAVRVPFPAVAVAERRQPLDLPFV